MTAQRPPARPFERIDRRRALLALGTLALAACKGVASTADGAPRVISLSPSTTEAVFAIGAGSHVVGRSTFCDHPPEVKALPAVGGFADPSIEAILALAPTLVIGAHGPAGPALEASLRARGVATFFPETESLAQIDAMITELGRLLDRKVGAQTITDATRARAAAVEAAVAGRPRVRAVLLFDVAPIVAAGPGGFPDELLRRAGGENAIQGGGAYPTVGLEHLLALAPDVLLDASTGARGDPGEGRVAALRDAPGWREIAAVRAGRVRLIDTSAALRPGPRIGEGLAAFARALHPDLVLPEGPAK